VTSGANKLVDTAVVGAATTRADRQHLNSVAARRLLVVAIGNRHRDDVVANTERGGAARRWRRDDDCLDRDAVGRNRNDALEVRHEIIARALVDTVGWDLVVGWTRNGR
jgi:hypothetical protein